MASGHLEARSCIRQPGISRKSRVFVLHHRVIEIHHRYDYTNKRIGVIGSGSSAIQIVPQMQKLEGVKVSSFVRNKTWIAMPFGAQAAEKLQLDHDQCIQASHLE